MNPNLFIVTGYQISTPLPQLTAAAHEVLGALSGSDSLDGFLSDRLDIARSSLKASLEAADDPNVVAGYEAASKDGLRLGNLLVMAGVVSFNDIDNAMECQADKSLGHVELGKMFVGWRFITQEQLEYLLKLKDAIMLPSGHAERFAFCLREMGVINGSELEMILSAPHDTVEVITKAAADYSQISEQTLANIASLTASRSAV